MHLPRYEVPEEQQFAQGDRYVRMSEVIAFTRWVVNRDKLEICHYLKDMTQEPFFLVAATGLGKTVAVPLHLLLRQMERGGVVEEGNTLPTARVWVVEPRIPIATDQMRFMNDLWQQFCKETSTPEKPKRRSALFGCITSAGPRNTDAPIMFITTGVFSLLAREQRLQHKRDRVVIDEAHVTLQDNADVELAMCIARGSGVTVDFMSATVDTSTLQDDLRITQIINADKQRQPVWKHNLELPLEECIVPLVRETLIQPNFSGQYYPQRNAGYPHTEAVLKAVREKNRSHGMLVVVNSFAGDSSDIRHLGRLLNAEFPELTVLELASKVVRNPQHLKAFEDTLKAAERAKRNYVILSTSVVEMGITFPTLDYVVTMDSGYTQETVGDTTFPVVGPLGVNSLLQRIGRVGRRRPGIAYVSCEVEAPYALLSDAQLNRKQSLAYEPIGYPLADSSLLPLAYFASYQPGWTDGTEWLASLEAPSRPEAHQQVIDRFNSDYAQLEALGITQNFDLTDFGARMAPWVGRTDLAYAATLQRELERGAPLGNVLFWATTTALSNLPISTLRPRHDFFVDHRAEHAEIPHAFDIWSTVADEHEDLRLFGMLTIACQYFGRTLWQDRISVGSRKTLQNWGNEGGIDIAQLRNAMKAVSETWELLRKSNPTAMLPELRVVNWAKAFSELETNRLHWELLATSGCYPVSFSEIDVNGDSCLEWACNGQTGLLHYNDTPLPIATQSDYGARLLPSREKIDSSLQWRLMHIGRVPDHFANAWHELHFGE